MLMIRNGKQLFNSFVSTCKRFNNQQSIRCAQVKRRPLLSHPALWYEDYPISLIGCRQSPISINKERCILNEQKIKLPPLRIEYPNFFNNLRIRNPKDETYFGWRVDVPYDFGDQAIVSGGPLNHRYKLIQFHAHWGKNCNCGSEHIIDGKSYSAELHFVHWNCDIYSSARRASMAKDGLVVIAVFLQATKECDINNQSETLETICKMIPEVKYKGTVKTIPKKLNLLELFPTDRSYYTYLGSLTTPPLWETVTWIIYEQPIPCTEQQLNAFREINYFQKEVNQQVYWNEIYDTNVDENIRPVQPLNDRQIIYVKRKQQQQSN